MTTPILARLPQAYRTHPTVRVSTTVADVRHRALAIHLTANKLIIRTDTGHRLSWTSDPALADEDTDHATGWAITDTSTTARAGGSAAPDPDAEAAASATAVEEGHPSPDSDAVT